MNSLRVVMTGAFVILTSAAFAAPAAAATTGQYAQLIHSINPRLAQAQTHNLALEVIKNAQRQHIDARLLVALVTVESHWRLDAVSRHGARGLGQLMPRTAHGLGVDARRPEQNLSGTSRYLAALLQRFGSTGEQLRLAIGAYNAGPNAILRHGGIPNNGETPAYVRRVLAALHAISLRFGHAAVPNRDAVIATVAPPVIVIDGSVTTPAEPTSAEGNGQL